MEASTAFAAGGVVRQLGHVVEDLEVAVDHWMRRLGVGPWTLVRNVTLECVFWGVASRPRVNVGIGYLGGMQIELIQQTNDAVSPYRGFIDRRQFGLHHSGFLSRTIDDDVDAALASGLKLACDVQMATGARYAYFASAVPGEQNYLKLIEATPVVVDMFVQGVRATAAWDGRSVPTVIDFADLVYR